MKRCFWCGSDNINWDDEYTYQDVGIDEQGVIQVYTCLDCGAHHEVWKELPEEGRANEID